MKKGSPQRCAPRLSLRHCWSSFGRSTRFSSRTAEARLRRRNQSLRSCFLLARQGAKRMAQLRDTADQAHAQWVREAAQRLADSGLCSNWRAVETALVERGYRDAPL